MDHKPSFEKKTSSNDIHRAVEVRLHIVSEAASRAYSSLLTGNGVEQPRLSVVQASPGPEQQPYDMPGNEVAASPAPAAYTYGESNIAPITPLFSNPESVDRSAGKPQPGVSVVETPQFSTDNIINLDDIRERVKQIHEDAADPGLRRSA